MKLKSLSINDILVLDGKQPFAKGGRGSIFRVQCKKMLSPNLRPGKIYLLKRPLDGLSISHEQQLIKHLDGISSRLNNDRKYFESRLALPLGIVLNNEGKYLGYLMDEFNDGCYFEQTGTSNTGAKLKQVRPFLTRKSERDILGTPHLTRLARLDLINDFFSTLSKLHKSGIVVGDISDANLIIRNKPGAKNSRRMIFLDVDSFSYRGNTHPLGPENTPNWFLPEHSQITINQRYSKQTDIYKGALLTNRILHQETTNDEDSFKVIKSEVAAEVLRDLQAKKVFDFLKSALSDVPNNRPTSEKLSEAFSELLARYRGMGKK